MKEYKVKDHASSLLPEGEWELVWSDEFDGKELDTSKWDYRLCMMGKRHPAWTDKGVHLDGNSNCVFTAMIEDGRPVSSQLQTGYNFMDEPVKETVFGSDHLQWNIGKLKEDKFLKKYGYFECRCKLQQQEGWWSAFWMQSPIIGASLDSGKTGSEIDIMECFHPGEITDHNIYSGGYGQDMQRRKVGGMMVDEQAWHTFGVKWDENGYTFYVDGKEDGRIDEFVSHTPQFILISTEMKGYRKEKHLPTDEAFAAAEREDVFLVDHVRVFEAKK